MLDQDMDKRIMDVNMEIAQEDIDLLVKLNPVRTPETTTKELLIATDAPVIEFRNFLKAWQAKGWRLNQELLIQQRGNTATAIASPNRCNNRNWVLDTAPLLKPL